MWLHRVEALRREFDGSFAAAPSGELKGRHGGGLAVRRGRHLYALALDDLAGIERSRGITAVPGSVPAALGLAVGRDRLIPVFDLPRILGAPADDLGTPTLLLLHRHRGELCAFACDEVVGRIDLPPAGPGGNVQVGDGQAIRLDLGDCRGRLAPPTSEIHP